MKTIAISLLVLFGAMSAASAEPAAITGASRRLVWSEQVFDFGHVGIDFKLFHTFYIANNGDTPVAITSATASCDCSHVRLVDSLIQPGDTAFLHLDFLTRNYYGPTTKSMEVTLDDPEFPEVKFFYLSTIGQWYGNLKPEPFSLFFLPGAVRKEVKLANRAFDQISWTLRDPGDSTFRIELVDSKADRGEQLALTVTPVDGLNPGTYLSSFTIHVTTADDQKPVILTIPVKIVKY